MAISVLPSIRPVSRRGFLKAGLCGAAGLALYAGEIERHWIEVTEHPVHLPGLSAAFDGMRIVQLSDIHLDDFTEPFFLRHAVERINQLKPDAVFLTGDFSTHGLHSTQFEHEAVWHCAEELAGLECKARYASLGNHDLGIGAPDVSAALADSGIAVLRNSYLPLERAGSRLWLTGVDDPLLGHPDPELAIPASIRNRPGEPVVLLCHGPDYADHLLEQPAGQAVDWMLSGHTHGGQVRLPLLGAMVLPVMGRKYVEGWFHLGRLQLYVNRGIGTIDLPFRFDCPPEISVFTLHARE